MATSKQVDIVGGSVSVKTDDLLSPVDNKSNAHGCVGNKTIKAAFDTAASHGLCSSYQYEKVAVLLVHWAKHLDPDLNCGPEVAELRDVFRDKYHYETDILTLHDTKSPQLQLEIGINDLIRHHDGHHRNHLLIVYYSGHGQETGNTFSIAGVRATDVSAISNRFPASADWMKATANLKTAAEADVLMVVDACYAGSIIDKNSSRDSRLVQALLAAGRNSIARRPGPNSFTRAMIEVLTTSHQQGFEAKGRYLDTSEIRDRIDERQKKHGIVTNLVGAHRVIKLMPLSDAKATELSPLLTDSNTLTKQGVVATSSEGKSPDQTSPAHLARPEASAISLRFSFSDEHAMTEERAKELGAELSQLARERLEHFCIRGIQMTEQIKIEPRSRYSKVVQLVELCYAVRKVERLWKLQLARRQQTGVKRALADDDTDLVDAAGLSTGHRSERPAKKPKAQAGLTVEGADPDGTRPMTPQSSHE